MFSPAALIFSVEISIVEQYKPRNFRLRRFTEIAFRMGRKTFGFVVRKLHILGAFFGAAGENFQDSVSCFPQIVEFCDFPQIVFSVSELSANCQFARRFSANCKIFSNLSAIVISANCSANCKGG